MICTCCDRTFHHAPHVVPGDEPHPLYGVCTAECLARAMAEHEAREERAYGAEAYAEAYGPDYGETYRSDAEGGL